MYQLMFEAAGEYAWREAPDPQITAPVRPGQTVAGPRRTSDSTTAAAANSPEKTRLSAVCLRGVFSHFSRRTDRPGRAP